MKIDRIIVDVAIDPKRRAATEHQVFARLATRAPDPAPIASRRPWLAMGLAASIAALVVTLLVMRRDTGIEPIVPSLITTPVGGSSRFTIDDIVVDAGPDTAALVARDANQTITMTLVRGTVECDVTPRGARSSFQVIAGEVVVEVVGTRFLVARRDEDIRIEVSHGLVAVITRGQRHMVGAGERWQSKPWHTAVPSTPEQPPRIATTPAPAPIRRPSAREAFLAAQRLETTNSKGAAAAYRALANGSDRYAALALLGLAELQATSSPGDALHAVAELERRFPNSSNLEDALWLRVDILAATGGDVRGAAASYLRRYPKGAYAEQAAQMAGRP